MSTKSHRRSERRKHLSPEKAPLSKEEVAGEIVVAFLDALSFGALATEE